MSYTAKDIRTICLLGHGGDGKTILAEDMLFLTNGSDRLGSIADGNTVSDFDPEEIKRQYSISTSIIPVEFDNCKINILDNPGFFDFAGEIVQSLRVADAGLIVLSAKGGISVGTEKAWKSLKDAKLPTMFYISKMDEDHANYYKVVDDMRAAFGNTVVPLIFPMMKGDKCVGLVDLLSRTARDTEGNSAALTPEAEARCDEYLAELSEQVAETSEETHSGRQGRYAAAVHHPRVLRQRTGRLRQQARDGVPGEVLPQPPGRPSHGDRRRRRAAAGPQGQPCGLRLQDRFRPVRQELLLQSHLR